MRARSGDTSFTFQPALPMRGVTTFYADGEHYFVFQPALPMRGVTLAQLLVADCYAISTRTPHAGSDKSPATSQSTTAYFNPHSPCGE